MDIGRSPIVTPVPTVDSNVTERGAQATELPQIQTVQQASALDSVSITFREVAVQPSQQEAEEPQLETVDTPNSLAFENREREIRREFEHDRETAALIFKSIDVSTGEVIQQYPEEARLNLRAYLGNKEEAQRSE